MAQAPAGSVRARGLEDTDQNGGAEGLGTRWRGKAPRSCQGSRRGPGLSTSRPAGPLGGLVVHKLSWVDAILFVKLVVLSGGHAGLLGQRWFLGGYTSGGSAGLAGRLLSRAA